MCALLNVQHCNVTNCIKHKCFNYGESQLKRWYKRPPDVVVALFVTMATCKSHMETVPLTKATGENWVRFY